MKEVHEHVALGFCHGVIHDAAANKNLLGKIGSGGCGGCGGGRGGGIYLAAKQWTEGKV